MSKVEPEPIWPHTRSGAARDSATLLPRPPPTLPTQQKNEPRRHRLGLRRGARRAGADGANHVPRRRRAGRVHESDVRIPRRGLGGHGADRGRRADGEGLRAAAVGAADGEPRQGVQVRPPEAAAAAALALQGGRQERRAGARGGAAGAPRRAGDPPGGGADRGVPGVHQRGGGGAGGGAGAGAREEGELGQRAEEPRVEGAFRGHGR